jgi:hypothetical protein
MDGIKLPCYKSLLNKLSLKIKEYNQIRILILKFVDKVNNHLKPRGVKFLNPHHEMKWDQM